MLSADARYVYDFFLQTTREASLSFSKNDSSTEAQQDIGESEDDPYANLKKLMSFLDQETLNYTAAGK